ncbi:MAG TPA: MG2 domain-containing protein, partial [Planctomycetota bacterium]|nr:MG2 domain-containing protein [Planctomycetota bacterium]
MSLKLVLAPVLAAVLALVAIASNGGGPQDPLSEADRAFADGTYSVALEKYREAAADPRFGSEEDRIATRIGSCLAKLNRGDEALEHLGAHAEKKKGLRGERLARVERGVVALTMPGWYTEKDGKRTRGGWVQGGTYVWTENENLLQGTADLEIARRLARVHRAEAPQAWNDLDATERLRGLLELAAGAERLVLRELKVPAERDVDGGDAYDAATTWKDRMFVAFDDAISAAEERGAAQDVALALYLKSGAARRVLRAWRMQEGGLEVAGHDGVWKPVDPARDPARLALAAREKARGLPVEESILFGLARTRHELQRFVDAVAAYRELVAAFPKGMFVGDARTAIEEITFPRLDVEVQRTHVPGKEIEIRGTIRNLAEVGADVYAVDAGKVWTSDDFLDDADDGLGAVDALAKAIGFKPSRFKPVATTTHATHDDGGHRPSPQTFRLPALERGTYLVRFHAGPLVRLALLNVSDLAMVLKTDEDVAYAWVVDAVTGAPVEGADVVVRERWTGKNLFGRPSMKERHARGRTDARGLFVRRHARVEGSFHVEALAVHGSRLALAPGVSVWTERGAARQPQAYVMTDRPVYRPGDPVRVAAFVSAGADLERNVLKGEIVRAVVSDPKGQKVLDREYVTDDDGAFDQEIVLGKEPPLGVYQVQLYRGKIHLRHATFRVEEYLKPEFKVEISPKGEETRLGETATATIRAEYYFGGPAAGADVTWTVLREPWAPRFRRDEPWRAFYGLPPEDEGPASFAAGREQVATGTGVLGPDGALDVAFDTAAFKDRAGEGSRFIVQAEVTDASRRTITAEDEVVVAKRALSLDVELKRAFFRAGETVELELGSQLVSGAPVAVKGTVRAARIRREASVKDGVRVEEIREELDVAPAETDARGLGFFRTVFDEPGRYALRFEAADKYEQTVFAEARFWVHAPGFRADGFETKNLELIAERRTWKVGETALVLVHAAIPDAAVFLTVEAGRRILDARVVPLVGKTALVEIPLAEAHAPNVHLHVACVRDGAYFEESLELFVPPTGKFLDVAVAYDKPEYKPGERGALVVTTKDADGRAVSARAAVTVLDASLFYIQNDVTPDVRRFHYGARRWAGVMHHASKDVA